MSTERFPIEAGHIMCFARAIGDFNPAYFEAMRSNVPVPAPPTFVQAGAQFDTEYRLRPKFGEPWFGSGRTASGVQPVTSSGGSGTSLHAEQHFTYHRPLRSGDVLTANVYPGDSWEKQGRRGGTLRFSETMTDYLDASGELVVTTRSVSVRTENVVERENDK
jgi:hypothetical protein